MTAYRDPAWVVRRAWSVLRLAELQALVNSTIAELHRLEPSQLLGREVYSPDGDAVHDPVTEALRACSDELRDESGMVDSEAERATHRDQMRQYALGQSEGWSAAYDKALDQYRRAASRTLVATLEPSVPAVP
jgi:hypothetical protein